MCSTTVATVNNAVQPRCMAEEKSSRNTAALNTIVSTLTVPTLSQSSSPLVDKENEEQFLDTRYKDKGKVFEEPRERKQERENKREEMRERKQERGNERGNKREKTRERGNERKRKREREETRERK
jgi:hypothetical protein